MMQAPDIGGMIFRHTSDCYCIDLPVLGEKTWSTRW
jgi:hypothetical protein